MKNKSFFGGTAYLGMPFNEKFKRLVFEGIERYGINFGASRNNNVTLDIFALAEAEAAKRYGAENAIIVSSGYLSAQLVIQHFVEDHKLIYAPDTHPALWIGKPKTLKLSFRDWSEQAVKDVNRSDRPVLLITNSLNNLFPEIYQFDWISKIKPGRKVTLLVDDSHGIGITGKNGEGAYSRIPKVPGVETIVIASMAKALGVDAGVILGTKPCIEKLRSSSIYAGASPPSPGVLYAYLNAAVIYQEELEKLRSNMKFFRDFLKEDQSLYYLEDFPVYLINDPDAGRYLLSNGILISSFAYPDPQGSPLNRVVLNSTHTKEEMRKLASLLADIKEQRSKTVNTQH